MAISYQAKIDLIVAGLDQIKTAERRIKSLLAESKKLKRGSVAQRGTAALAATTRESRQQSRSTVRAAERRLELQSKLNSATDLYQRKLQQFQRAGGQNNKQLQARVDQITQAFTVGTKEGTKNLRLTRALGTELGRVVEKQLELNRARAQANKGFEAGRRGFERVEALRSQAFGNEKGLRAAESLVGKIGPAARSGDQVAFNEAVRKADAALRRLESEFQQAVKAQRKANKTKRDVERAEQKLANETKKAARDRASRRKKRFQDIATGAGFPLLFGGGPIQSLAGGLGGAFGGFGGSIAASALVAQFEGFAKTTAEVGQALKSTGGALDFVREKSLFSSEEQKELAVRLEEQGDAAGLAALLTEELTDKIGNKGVEALQGLGDETDKTTKLWNELTLQLQSLIAGPLTKFLEIVNSVLGVRVAQNKFSAALGDAIAAAPGRKKEIKALLEGERNLGVNARGLLSNALFGSRTAAGVADIQGFDTEALERMTKFLNKIVEEAGPKKPLIPVTPEDERRFTVRDTAAEKARRQEARIRQRLAALEEERKKILEISDFKDKIAAAEAVNDSQLVIRLQGEQQIAEIEAERLKDLTKVTDQRLIDAINIKATTEKLAAQRNTERQITEEQRKRKELFATTIEGLEHQLKMTEATSQVERDRLSIAKQLKDLGDKGFTPNQLSQAKSIMERQAKAQQPLSAFIRKSTEDLNNLEQVAVNISQGIGNAVGNSMTSGIMGLIEGTKAAKQVFADFLKDVGQILAQEGAKMIATYIAIGVAKAFAGLTGGGSDPGFDTSTPLPGGMEFGHLASGGPAEANRPYIVGERGPELFVPSQSGGVMRNEDMRQMMGRSPAGAGAPQMNFTFETTNIGGTEFVSREQLEQAMVVTRRQATNDGAKRGMSMTLDKMQNSPRTRSRVGIG